jgi:hypothetical protein
LAGGGGGGSVPTYVLGTFYIRFFLYQCYDIPVSGEAHCSTSATKILGTTNMRVGVKVVA